MGPDMFLHAGADGAGNPETVSKAAHIEVRGRSRSPSHVGSPLLKEACIQLRWWYSKTKEHPTPPLLAHVNIVWMMEERVDLYRIAPPHGRSILGALDPFPANDLISYDEEVPGAVWHLCLNRASRKFGLKSEYLQA